MPSRLAVLIVVLLASASPASAQSSGVPDSSPASAPAILVSGGYAAFADDGRIDHGAGGVGVEWRVRSHLALGADMSYMVGPGADRDLLVAGVLRASVVRWNRAVVPYGLVAAGALLHRDRIVGMDHADLGMLLQVGGGIRVAASRRVFIAPEFAIGGPPHIRATLTVGVTLR